MNECSVTALSSRPVCPSPDGLSPCTCDLEGISCNKAIDGEDLRRALSIHDGTSEYRGFWMVETDVTVIQNGTFKHNVFRNVYLPHNHIDTIEPDAFLGLENVAKLVELQFNRLQKIPLSALTKLKFLEELVISKNQIEDVPESAFTSFVHLNTIRLESNKISHLGKNAFDIASLRELNLENNMLKSIGERAFFISNSDEAMRLILKLGFNEIEEISQNAFDGRTGALDSVNLRYNTITSFKKDMFGQLLHIVNISFNVQLDVSGNTVDCDKNMNWILDYPVTTRAQVKGITCLRDGNIVDMH